MPSLTMNIQHGSQKEKSVLELLRSRHTFSKNKMKDLHASWKSAEEQAVAYMYEKDVDASRSAKRDIGQPQFTTLAIPYSYSVLMSAHTYYTSVLLSRLPIFQFSPRHGETYLNVQAIESVIDYQVSVGRHLVPYYIWLMDVGKYGIGVLGHYWEDEVRQISKIEEIEETVGFGPVSFKTGRKIKKMVTGTLPGYSGNRVFNVRPTEWFPDTRVPLNRFQEGEFVGREAKLGWNTIMRRANEGFYMKKTVDKLQQRGDSNMRDTSGESDQLVSVEDSLQLSHENLKDVNQRHVIEQVVELVPRWWGLGDSTTPEKWFFTSASGHDMLLQASPLGAWHNSYPFDVIELEPEGYSLVNRGHMEITKTLQDTMDWLFNTHFYNVRKALNDQFIIDPSKANMSDALDPLPGGYIRLRPEAYGTDVRTVLHQLQVVDVTRGHLADAEILGSLFQRVSGVSDNTQGLVNQGGRKTATEIRSANTSSAGRLKTQTEFFSVMGFAPLSQKLIQNTQQYLDTELILRVAGDLLGANDRLKVTPKEIAGFYDYVIADGNAPVDRYAQVNLWRMLLQEMRADPALMQQYDRTGLWQWIAQLAGLRDLNRFKIQVTPDDALQSQAQTGNLVSLQEASNARQRTNTGGATPNVLEPGQIEGMGATG